MWSKVLLVTGAVLTACSGLASAILLKRLKNSTATSLNVLAASQAVISTLIGLMLIVLGSTAFDEAFRATNLECTRATIVSQTAAFVLPYVSSFVSMLVTAVEYWMVVSERGVKADKHKFQFMKTKKRLATALVAQWSIPMVLVALLLLVVNEKTTPLILKSIGSNETCSNVDMITLPMDIECPQQLKTQLKIQEANNITASIVERIYQLLQSTGLRGSENIDIHLPSYDQDNKGWKTLEEHYTKMKDNAETIHKKKHEMTSGSPDEPPCKQQCTLNSTAARVYVTGVTIFTYVISLIGTTILHFSTKAKIKTSLATDDATAENSQSNHYACKHVKNAALPTFFMWTPILIERLLSKWFCQSAPQWVVALLFILGQMSTALQGALNVKLPKQCANTKINMIHPIETSTQQARMKLPQDHTV